MATDVKIFKEGQRYGFSGYIEIPAAHITERWQIIGRGRTLCDLAYPLATAIAKEFSGETTILSSRDVPEEQLEELIGFVKKDPRRAICRRIEEIVTQRQVMSTLCYANLPLLLEQMGKIRGSELYRALLETSKTYGVSYAVEFAQKVVRQPGAFKLPFPSVLGQIYAIKFFGRAYLNTGNEGWVEGVRGFIGKDSLDNPEVARVTAFAKETLEGLQPEIDKRRREGEKAREKYFKDRANPLFACGQCSEIIN